MRPVMERCRDGGGIACFAAGCAVAAAQQLSDKFAPFANFMTANSAGAVVWVLFHGLGAYYLGKGVEEFARPFAMR
jgi:hypothetical protein